jgi:hypothetical protein
MPVSVEFDDKPGSRAKEVCDIRTKRLLAAEAHFQPRIAQQEPELTLGISRVLTQRRRKAALEFPTTGMSRLSDYRHRTAARCARTPPRNLLRKFRPSLKGRVRKAVAPF